MIKRRLGSTLNAQRRHAQSRAMLLKAIAHNLLILLTVVEVFCGAGLSPFYSSLLGKPTTGLSMSSHTDPPLAWPVGVLQSNLDQHGMPLP
jgi:hypothetical protein